MVDGRERAIFFCEQLLTYTLVTLLMKLSGSQNTIQKKTKTHMKEESILLGKKKGISKKEREIHMRVNMTEICHVLHGYRELGSKGTKKGQTHI